MTPTNDERREVARKLREPKESLLAHLDEELIRLRYETGCKRGQDIYEHLSDLIDRPTCSMRDTGDKFEQVYRCSACGEEYCMSDIKTYPWRYCPGCGARVVEKEEDDD